MLADPAKESLRNRWLQARVDLYYTGVVDGVPLYEWTEGFVKRRSGWVDLLQDLIPFP